MDKPNMADQNPIRKTTKLVEGNDRGCAAQKYNAKISVMGATSDLRLNMSAFHHPLAKNRSLRTTSKVMKCLQNNHKPRSLRT